MEARHAKHQKLLDFCKSLPPNIPIVDAPFSEASATKAVELVREGKPRRPQCREYNLLGAQARGELA